MNHQLFLLKTDLFKEFVVSKNRITLVEAPCGYGKTTLLAYMYNQKKDSEAISIWLTLKPKNNVPKYFKRCFLRAAYKNKNLLNFFESLNPDKYNIEHDRIIDLIEDFTHNKKVKIDFYIDDFHLISNTDIIEFIEEISENENISVSIASRTEISANFGTELDITRFPQNDFLFDHTETQVFINKKWGISLRPAVNQLIYKKTAGWPKLLEILGKAHLEYPVVSGPENLSNAEMLKIYSGSCPELIEYLDEGLLKNITAELKDFLLKSSLFSATDEILCHALVGDEAPKIIKLTRSCNFITCRRINNKFSFSLPEVIKEYLLYSVVHSKKYSEKQIMVTAADWFISNNQLVKATQTLIAAKVYRTGARLLSKAKNSILAEGSIIEVTSWFNDLPSKYVENDVNLLFLQAWQLLHASNWKAAEKNLLKIIELKQQLLEPIKDKKRYDEELLLLYVGIDHLKLTPLNILEYCDKNKQILIDIDTDVMGSIENIIALSYFVYGDYDKMLHFSEQAFATNIKANRTYPRAVSQSLKILAELGLGNFNEAKASTGILRVEFKKDANESIYALSSIIEGIAAYEMGDPDRSYIFSAEGVTLLKDCVSHHVQALAVRRYATIAALRGYADSAVYLFHLYNDHRAEKLGSHYENVNNLEIMKILLIANDIRGANEISNKINFNTNLFGIQAQMTKARLNLERGDSKNAISILNTSLDQKFSVWERLERSLLIAYAHYVEQNHEEAQREFKVFLLGMHEGNIMLMVELGQKSFDLYAKYVNLITPNIAKDQKYKIEKAFENAKKAYEQLTGNIVEDTKSKNEYTLIEPLSKKEQQVLDLIVLGHTNKRIADDLFISINTVKWHVRHILEKFCVKKRTQVIAIVNKNI